MKPRNGYHYPDPAFSWDDAGPNHIPMAQQLSTSEPEKGEIAAVIWVPDIEQRHGWREVWVRRDVTEVKQRRAGFR